MSGIFLAALFALQFIFAPLPDLKLTPKDFLTITAEYGIYYDYSPTFCGEFNGKVDFRTRQISICGHLDNVLRTITLFHEMYHVLYRQHLIRTDGPYEDLMTQKAYALYQEIFGVPVETQQEAPIPQEK